jgi:hypothetical protein
MRKRTACIGVVGVFVATLGSFTASAQANEQPKWPAITQETKLLLGIGEAHKRADTRQVYTGP